MKKFIYTFVLTFLFLLFPLSLQGNSLDEKNQRIDKFVEKNQTDNILEFGDNENYEKSFTSNHLALIGGLSSLFSDLSLSNIPACFSDKDMTFSPVCFDEKTIKKFKKIKDEYPLLYDIVSSQEIKTCDCAKYLAIADTEIDDKSFRTLFFELPNDLLSKSNKINVTITQKAGHGFDSGMLFTNLFVNLSNEKIIELYKKDEKFDEFSRIKSILLKSLKTDEENYLIRKEGEIIYTSDLSKTAMTTISLYPDCESVLGVKYAMLIELNVCKK